MGDGFARRRELSAKILWGRALCIFVALVIGIVGFGSGLASAADPLIGKKYSDAASWISQRNGTPVVATVSGSQLALDDCVVISWSRGGFLNNSGRNDRRNEYYVNLNCNNQVASAGHPGNSVMTPEGARAKKQRQQAEAIKRKPEACQKDESTFNWCRRVCLSTGLCSVGLYVASSVRSAPTIRI